MKINVLSLLLQKIRAGVTEEEFEKIENVIFEVAENSGDLKIIMAAKFLRLVLESKELK